MTESGYLLVLTGFITMSELVLTSFCQSGYGYVVFWKYSNRLWFWLCLERGKKLN
ncbi:hypothetical protein L208DRAFT_1406382 [Tricholoma matsutake]|nr:hypothetical protein L208DRAFT_1406382 [Tricholoma matsutake 945]